MSKLEFPHADVPLPGEHIVISDGIHWVRQSLPFVLDHVNCWFLNSSSQSTLIDTGVNNPKSVAALQSHFEKLGRPDQLLVTHFHPDHSGLAGWFAQLGVEVLSHEVEFEIVHRLWGVSDEASGQYYANWYQQHGIQGKPIDQALKRGNGYRKMLFEPPAKCGYLNAGESVVMGGKHYEVKIGRGHAPSMIMLFDPEAKVLIAADQVLPTISPNVSWMPNSTDENPLQSFIDTLKVLRLLPSDTLVLPSHGLPFYGLHDRIDDLLAHHELRCNQILDACGSPKSASDLFTVLFKRELDAQQLSFALGEALAHTKYLCNLGSLSELNNQTVVQFQTTSV